MTLFNTPILSPILRFICRVILKLIGWRGVGGMPEGCRRGIMIAAPHTSNWDFALFILIVFDLRLNLRVLIKHTLFIGPVGWFLKYCGGIPVDRRASGARVRSLSNILETSEDFVLLITPEGTRSPTDRWKTGFYHMAVEAKVPIIVAYVDVLERAAGVDHVLQPSGDLAADMKHLSDFYATKTGIKKDNFLLPDPRHYAKH
jgi:1-acyl-sn-glycerol-3-phosphate acyltransferase